MPKYIVLDTNIVLLDATNILTLGGPGTVIVLPETVIDELDNKKSSSKNGGDTELQYQARHFGRLLAQAKRVNNTDTGKMVISELLIDETVIHVASCSDYPTVQDAEQNIKNDRKIIHVAELYTKKYGNEHVTFMTNDTMCLIRAESLGVYSREYRAVKNLKFNFTKELEVDEETFRTLHNKQITEVDSEYEIQNYNYKFSTPNSSQIKLATINNKRISIVGKDTEDELRRQDISPVNAEQLLFSRALQDTTIDIVVSDSLTGSGKSLIALSNGIRMVNQGHYDKIIYIRASVNDVPQEEEIGFLSTNEAKYEVYLHPLEDSLEAIARNRLKGGKLKGVEYEERVKEEILKIREKGNIEGMIGLGLRGRTFDNAYIIVDECLHEDQKVQTSFGTITAKELEQLCIHNKDVKMFSVNLETLNIEEKPLLSLRREHISRTKEKMYEVEMEDGSALRITGSHKLHTPDGYMTLLDIKEKLDHGIATDITRL